LMLSGLRSNDSYNLKTPRSFDRGVFVFEQG
jgi:hypothetical protein